MIEEIGNGALNHASPDTGFRFNSLWQESPSDSSEFCEENQSLPSRSGVEDSRFTGEGNNALFFC